MLSLDSSSEGRRFSWAIPSLPGLPDLRSFQVSPSRLTRGATPGPAQPLSALFALDAPVWRVQARGDPRHHFLFFTFIQLASQSALHPYIPIHPLLPPSSPLPVHPSTPSTTHPSIYQSIHPSSFTSSTYPSIHPSLPHSFVKY